MTAISQTMLFAGRGVRRFLRSPAAVVYTVGLPLVLFVTQLASYGEIIKHDTGQPYVARLAPLVILATVAFGAATSATGMYRDLNHGMTDRIRTMPIPGGSFVAGRVIGDVLRVLLVAAVTVLVAYLPGFRFRQGVPAALAFFAVVALFGLMWSWLAMLRAFGGPNEEAIQSSLSGIAIVAFVLSTGFVPERFLVGFLQPVAHWNPMSLATETLVGLSSGGPVAESLLATVAWVVVVGTLCAILTVRRYARLNRR